MGPSHVCEFVHTSKLYRLSDNLNSFFDIISTHSISKLPNSNRAFVLVYQLNDNLILYSRNPSKEKNFLEFHCIMKNVLHDCLKASRQLIGRMNVQSTIVFSDKFHFP